MPRRKSERGVYNYVDNQIHFTEEITIKDNREKFVGKINEFLGNGFFKGIEVDRDKMLTKASDVNLRLRGLNYNKVFNHPKDLSRAEIISVGMIFGFNRVQTDTLLEIMNKQILYPRSLIEAAVIFVLNNKRLIEYIDIKNHPESVYQNKFVTLNNLVTANQDVLDALTQTHEDILLLTAEREQIEFAINNGKTVVDILDKHVNITLSQIEKMIIQENVNDTRGVAQLNVTGEYLAHELNDAIENNDFSLFVTRGNNYLCTNRRRSLYCFYEMMYNYYDHMIARVKANAQPADELESFFKNHPIDIANIYDNPLDMNRILNDFWGFFVRGINSDSDFLKYFFEAKTIENKRSISKLMIKKHYQDTHNDNGKKVKIPEHIYNDRYTEEFINVLRQTLGLNEKKEPKYILDDEDINAIFDIVDGNKINNEAKMFINNYLEISDSFHDIDYDEQDFFDEYNIDQYYKSRKEKYNHIDVLDCMTIFARKYLGNKFKGAGRGDPYTLRINERNELYNKVINDAPNPNNNKFKKKFLATLCGEHDIPRDLFIAFSLYFNTYEQGCVANAKRYLEECGYAPFNEWGYNDSDYNEWYEDENKWGNVSWENWDHFFLALYSVGKEKGRDRVKRVIHGYLNSECLGEDNIFSDFVREMSLLSKGNTKIFGG